MAFEIVSVRPGQKRGWVAWINGMKCDDVTSLELVNEKVGAKISYGWRPEGHDGCAIRLNAGGGAVTLPYAITPEGDLLIALVKEWRLNITDKHKVWCTVGGFVDPKKTHDETAKDELAEEAGIDAEPQSLSGLLMVTDRHFYVADPFVEPPEGVKPSRVKIEFSQLEYVSEDRNYKFRTPPISVFKSADEIRFMPWRDAVRCTPDALACGAIAHFLADVAHDGMELPDERYDLG